MPLFAISLRERSIDKISIKILRQGGVCFLEKSFDPGGFDRFIKISQELAPGVAEAWS